MFADDEPSFRSSPEYRWLIEEIRAALADVRAHIIDGPSPSDAQIARVSAELDRLATEAEKLNDLVQRLTNNGGGR